MMTGKIEPQSAEETLDEIGRVRGFAYSGGRYVVTCRMCDRHFYGDKRAYECLPCALAGPQVSEQQQIADAAIERIKNDG